MCGWMDGECIEGLVDGGFALFMFTTVENLLLIYFTLIVNTRRVSDQWASNQWVVRSVGSNVGPMGCRMGFLWGVGLETCNQLVHL